MRGPLNVLAASPSGRGERAARIILLEVKSDILTTPPPTRALSRLPRPLLFRGLDIFSRPSGPAPHSPPLLCAQETDPHACAYPVPFPLVSAEGDTNRREEQRWAIVFLSSFLAEGWHGLSLLMPSDSPGPVGLLGLSDFRPRHRVIHLESEHTVVPRF